MRAIHQPSAITSATAPSVSRLNAIRNARIVCANGSVSTPTIRRTAGRSAKAARRIDSVRYVRPVLGRVRLPWPASPWLTRSISSRPLPYRKRGSSLSTQKRTLPSAGVSVSIFTCSRAQCSRSPKRSME